MRKWVGNLLRAGVAVAVFIYLFGYKLDLRAFGETVRHVHPGWLALAVGLFSIPFTCGVLRFWLLLRCQGIKLPVRRVGAICFVGQFFNAFLLGGTGGDVIKAYYVTRQTQTQKTEAATAVIVDRIVGLIGLFTVLLVMVIWQFPLIRDHRALQWPTGVALLIVLAGLIIVPVTMWPGLRDRLAWLKPSIEKLPGGEHLSRAARSYQGYTNHPKILLQTWLLSVLVHVANFISTTCIGHALGLEIGWSKFFLCVPVINTIASLPITVSGFGVREELYRRMFGEFGVAAESAVAIGLLSYGTHLVWSLVGGLVYMFWQHEPHLARHAREELVAVEPDQADVSKREAGT